MCVRTLIFANVWPQIKQIWVIFTHLKLLIAAARHNFKWVKIKLFDLAIWGFTIEVFFLQLKGDGTTRPVADGILLAMAVSTMNCWKSLSIITHLLLFCRAKAVYAYCISELILPFGFAQQLLYWYGYHVKTTNDVLWSLIIGLALCINHLSANLSDINFHPLEAVSRYRDPQLQAFKQ